MVLRRWALAGGQEEQDCDWKSSITVRFEVVFEPMSEVIEGDVIEVSCERGVEGENLFLRVRNGFIVERNCYHDYSSDYDCGI